MRPRATAPMSAIIADDEPLARDELKFLLDQIGDVEVVATAANGLEALDAIERLDPALAFLDIQMPGLDGLSVVRRLQERQIEPPHIIFSTAFDQYAVEAFRLDAMDYLLKPVDRERLEQTVSRARKIVADRIIEVRFERLTVLTNRRLMLEAGVYIAIANHETPVRLQGAIVQIVGQLDHLH